MQSTVGTAFLENFGISHWNKAHTSSLASLHRSVRVRLKRTYREMEMAVLATLEMENQDKLRGGYYTSPELASWLCEWAIRKTTDRILEPSCGDGVFLSAAIDRLKSLGELSHTSIANGLRGIEVEPGEAEKANRRLRAKLGDVGDSSILSLDFFYWWQEEGDRKFDVVVGNPPFIRYRNFPEAYRTRALGVMTQLGLKANRLTNIWVPFVVAAAQSLREGGRLAFVLPAELLQVSYASQLRSYLVDRFSRIDIITCNQLLFDGAEQEVVLFLAEGVPARPFCGRGVSGNNE